MQLQFLLSMATLAVAQSVTSVAYPDASALVSQLNQLNNYVSTMDAAAQSSLANAMNSGYEQGVSIANSFISTIQANTTPNPTPTKGETSQGAAPTFGAQGMMAGLAGVGIAALGML